MRRGRTAPYGRPRVTGAYSIPSVISEPWIVWGIDLSYFTGKLEAILRAKGVRYERRNVTMARWRRLAQQTGVQHVPIVERADGSMMSDTTLIHRWLEDNQAGPTLSPATPHARFIARLIEDWGDESLWRPAMYWRWKQKESRHMQASRIAEQVGREMPLPRWLKIRMVSARQYGFYVWGDGVRTKAHRQATDRLYLDLLDTLDPLVANRPFLLGSRPTEADFGLFGPFFRHFFCDPLPSLHMQDRAPHLLHWVTRMWVNAPQKFQDEEPITTLPDDVRPILSIIARDHLPYLWANARAVAAGQRRTRYPMHGSQWSEFTKPFRVWCLAELQREFAALDAGERSRVGHLLGDEAIGHLTAPLPCEPVPPPALPIMADRRVRAQDSWMR